MNSKTYLVLEWFFKIIAMLNSIVFFLFFGIAGVIFNSDPVGGEITRSDEKLLAYFLFVFGLIYFIPNSIIKKSRLFIISYIILILFPFSLLIIDDIFYNLLVKQHFFIESIKNNMVFPLILSLSTLLSLFFSILRGRNKLKEG
jgi:hypothetical protein